MSDAIESPRLGNIFQRAVPAHENARIEIREILANFGTAAYGPALFFFSLVELLPFVSAIPGMFIFTSSAMTTLGYQLFIGRPTPWLPNWILNRSFSRVHLREQLKHWNPWMKTMERIVHPRLVFMTSPPFLQVIAFLCMCLALSFFPLAPIPAAEKVPAVPIALFALAITARDGLMAILGFIVCGASIGLLIYFWPTLIAVIMKGLEMMGM